LASRALFIVAASAAWLTDEAVIIFPDAVDDELLLGLVLDPVVFEHAASDSASTPAATSGVAERTRRGPVRPGGRSLIL
jgi:hypothetical protein